MKNLENARKERAAAAKRAEQEVKQQEQAKKRALEDARKERAAAKRKAEASIAFFFFPFDNVHDMIDCCNEIT